MRMALVSRFHFLPYRTYANVMGVIVDVVPKASLRSPLCFLVLPSYAESALEELGTGVLPLYL